ncbi:adenylyl-sulfate kinase [Candidatus Parcubacteria bacterium]|nr:MAG: adenylyl-sulfate kinase [Candidatus Parcubacteria bacterium]
MSRILWFTGLSGSGKTTLARALKTRLEASRKIVSLVDGDDVREKHATPLGFSRDDIRKNNRLLAELALKQSADNDFVLVSAISPYAEDRANSRALLGDQYIEVFVDTPLSICIERDVKGLYAKGKRGEMEIIGMSDNRPYERPERPDIRISAETSVHKSIEKLWTEMRAKKLI